MSVYCNRREDLRGVGLAFVLGLLVGGIAVSLVMAVLESLAVPL